MVPLVGLCCQVLSFKPHKKKITIKTISRSFEKSFKNYRPIFLVKVVQNAKKTEAIHPSYCRHATDTRLLASRPHLFYHLSHQIPKMNNSQ